jgi:hypothetical protein
VQPQGGTTQSAATLGDQSTAGAEGVALAVTTFVDHSIDDDGHIRVSESEREPAQALTSPAASGGGSMVGEWLTLDSGLHDSAPTDVERSAQDEEAVVPTPMRTTPPSLSGAMHPEKGGPTTERRRQPRQSRTSTARAERSPEPVSFFVRLLPPSCPTLCRSCLARAPWDTINPASWCGSR